MSDWNPKANEVFLAALEINALVERNAFVVRTCAGDGRLRQEVELLLAAAAMAGSFLDRPVVEEGLSIGEDLEQTHTLEGAKRTGNSAAEDKASTKDSIASGTGVSTFIGPYKLLQRIGEGGMGEVWMAEQEQPVRRRVALKVIKQGLDSRQVIARFEAERQALAMMDHQNIAKVLDVGTTPTGQPFFVMELVNGIPITKYCDANKLRLDERLALFIPVCHAIQHAHQKGIVHRDLKPSNVLVTLYDGKPVPKVIDFGLAKALQHQHKLTDKTLFTEFGQVVGTLQYMSPEQAEMNSLDIDTRTDVYSLGVMLYELLTGSTPIEKETLQKEAVFKVLETIRETDPPRPSARLSSSGEAITGISEQRRIDPRRLQKILRGDLDWIVMKALEKDRTRRYDSATAFSDDLARFLSSEPIRARPPSAIYRMRKFVRKNRGFVSAAATIATLFIAGGIGTTWFGISANIARNAAKLSEKAAIFEKAKSQAAGEAAKTSELAAIESRDETDAALSRMGFHLANSRWKERRAREAVELLYTIPEKHRQLEWHLARRQFEGSDLSLYGHTEPVKRVAVSTDGTRFVSGAYDGTVKLWDAVTGEEINTLAVPIGESQWIEGLALSPNSSLVAYCVDKTIDLRDARTGKLHRSLEFPVGSQVTSLAFSPDGETLASTCGDDLIVLWDVHTGAELRRIPTGQVNYLDCIAFSPDGTQLVSEGDHHFVRLWDIKTGAELRTFTWETQTVESVAFSPDGSLVGAANNEGDIALWDVRTGALVHVLTGHTDIVNSIAFSPAGTRLASASDDDTIKLWDVTRGTELQTLTGHTSNVNSVAFSPDGSRIVSASEDRLVKVWDARCGFPNSSLQCGVDSLHSLAFSPNSEWIATGGKTIQLWDVRTGSLARTISGHTTAVDRLKFSPDGTKLISNGFDNQRVVKVWDVESGTELSRLNNVSFYMDDTGFSPEGFPAAASADGTLYWWDSITGAKVRSVSAEGMQSVAFSLNGKHFAAANQIDSSNRCAIYLCDAATGTKIRSGTLKRSPRKMFFSPDEKILAVTFFSGTNDEEKLIGLWDLRSGSELRVLVGHPAQVDYVAFSPGGSRLASASSDGSIKLWDVNEGVELGSFVGHSGRGQGVAFSPDGSFLATIGENGIVQLRNVGTEAEIRVFPGNAEIRRVGGRITTQANVGRTDDRGIDTVDRLFVDNRRAWINEQGDKIPMPADWPQLDEISNPSSDGKWLAVPFGTFVGLVDLEFKSSPKEKGNRQRRAKLDAAWHAEQAELSEKSANWSAATFHRAWVMKADPASGTTYDALHAAYDNWRNPIADKGNQIGADGIESNSNAATSNAIDPKPPSTTDANQPKNPDQLLAPVVREMLALPRGAEK